MKNQLAFGSLLFLSSCLVAPAALAQSSGAPAPAAPPSGAVVDPAPQQNVPEQEAPAEELEISAPGASDIGDIVVRGNIPSVVRATPQVVSVLSAADIARTGEGDIAGALQRVTGLSVVGNGFVYVRGLGDRYSLSLLNGLPLPSPEPLRRVVPLDIFPTNVIASSLVQKSFSANYPGEFGGGVINLTTRATPDETFFQIGASVGFDTVTTSELGYVHDGGSYDWTGFDSGERDVPQFVIRAGENQTPIESAQVAQLTNAETTLVQAQWHIPPNFSGEASFGTTVPMGGDAEFGIIAGAGISNSWRTRDAIQQVAIDDIATLGSDFRRVTTDHRALVNGLLGFGLEFGDHRIRATNLYIHDTLKQTRLGQGENENNNLLNVQNTNWFERQLYTGQLVGEFDFGEFDVDVRGAYANTQRSSPYERTFTYVYSSAVDDFVNGLGNNPSGATIVFSDLNEDVWAGGVDLAYEWLLDTPITFSAGYAYTDTARDSYRYEFDYAVEGGGGLGFLASQQRPDALISDTSIFQNDIILRPLSTSLGARSYDAMLRIHGAYVQAETELWDALRAQVGVRYESAEQQVRPSDNQPASLLENDYWLPASTITWNFMEDMQLRLHGSKTIARPQFRELAPQLYSDFDSSRTFYGNPFLVDTEIWNLEARYEWYFGNNERVLVAGFYKDIENPIETVTYFLPGSSGLQTNFTNAPRAELYGVEFELQKYVPLDFVGDFFASRRLLLIGNYTYSQSEVLTDGQVRDPITPANFVPASQVFASGLPLVGQSEHLVNVQVGIEDTDTLSQLTLLFNYASDRIVARGVQNGGGSLPPVTERPGLRLDLVARQGFEVLGGSFEIKFEARNLTGEDFEEFQDFGDAGRVETNTYRLGRVFSLGVSTTF
ncbi:outer membrane beta-barrel protein [Sphingosinithalassobacter sp. CS137]|uniref:outer membrane beta-barrel protein n=1 Tax=Sphingosinithalassobacter sp. CS137 TaxID=2762748 RepID=UPI00165E1CB4|nr:outer membrane beta-barrel protein [Sphingosinithalassobacter sp. CS137]